MNNTVSCGITVQFACENYILLCVVVALDEIFDAGTGVSKGDFAVWVLNREFGFLAKDKRSNADRLMVSAEGTGATELIAR